MASKPLPGQKRKISASDQQDSIAEDITRIVGYLNEKRSSATDRSTDLARELAQRRDELSSTSANNLANQLSEIVQELPDRKPSSAIARRTNPVLAERYHSFCHDLDLILDSFRARVEGNKPVRH